MKETIVILIQMRTRFHDLLLLQFHMALRANHSSQQQKQKLHDMLTKRNSDQDMFYVTGFNRTAKKWTNSIHQIPTPTDLRPTLSPQQYMVRMHISKDSCDFGNSGVPKPSELVLAHQTLRELDKDRKGISTSQVMFRTFQKQCESTNLIDEIKQIPSPMQRLNFVLLHNNHQKDLIRHNYQVGQFDAIGSVIDRIEERKRQEQKSELRVKVKKKVQNLTPTLVTEKEKDKERNKKKVLFDSNDTPRQSVSVSVNREVKLLAPLFYIDYHSDNRDKGGVRPSVCESSSFSIVGDKGYVYGGLGGGGIVNNMLEYDIKSYQWNVIPTEGLAPYEGRTGHSVLQYQNYLVIFGGSQMYNKRIKQRECFNSVHYFNLNNKQWSKPTCTGGYVLGRRHHKVVLFNTHFMFVYGGIDSGENVLSEMMIFNLSRFTWKHLKNPPGCEVAYHSMINLVSEVGKKQRDEMKDQIYTFGGKNAKSQATNKLMVLQYHQATDLPDHWEEAASKGQPPAPSYSHTMEYNQKLNCLLIIGGRSDDIPEGGSECSVLSSVYMFHLGYSTWLQVKMRGLVLPRCNHVSALYASNKILVFGGIGRYSYLEADMMVIEMDPTAVSHKIAREKNKTDNTSAEQTIAAQPTDFVKQKKVDLWDDAPQRSQKKRTLVMRFREWQDENTGVRSFLPVPKKIAPKIRYDLFIEFLTVFLKKNIENLFPVNQISKQQTSTTIIDTQ